ncbi:unnamed protein product, partial [Ectocarpus sp. 8 AP-2014]
LTYSGYPTAVASQRRQSSPRHVFGISESPIYRSGKFPKFSRWFSGTAELPNCRSFSPGVRTQPHPYRLSSRRRLGPARRTCSPPSPTVYFRSSPSANDPRYPAPRPEAVPPFSTSSIRRKKNGQPKKRIHPGGRW